ncbi:MAG: triose-phosphate isomerase, partial [Anaerolineae bacterium]
MPTPFLAGNWKMNKTIDEALAFVEAVKGPLEAIDAVDYGICAPFTALAPLHDAVAGTRIKLGAQNMYWEESGAFTGEISPLMLKGLCENVVIGHSERRQYFGETDETVNRKIKAALEHGLQPIVCVGENLEQNEAEQTEEVVSTQVRGAFADLREDQVRDIVIAYEPIWAIGTGKAATPKQANDVIGNVGRATVADMFGTDVAEQMVIQYGGSIKPANVEELMSQPEINGGLVGGASLDPESFVTLV